MDHTVLIFQDTEPDVLARVLHALEPLPAEAAGVREGVRVLHLVLPVSRASAEPAQIVKVSFTAYVDVRGVTIPALDPNPESDFNSFWDFW